MSGISLPADATNEHMDDPNTDDPKLARAELEDLVNKFNALLDEIGSNRLQWPIELPGVAYASATSFTTTDASDAHVGRIVQISGSTTGTVYGPITGVSGNTITVAWASLSNESLSAWLALNSAQNTSIPWPFVDVRDFGAVGDGTTDDTAAIQAAIDSLTNGTGTQNDFSRGGTILFPRGKYRLASTLHLRTGDIGVRLLGESRDSSIIYIDHAGTGIDTGNDGTPVRPTLGIEHLKFISSETSRTAGSKALHIRWRYFFWVAHCLFAGRQEYAIHGDTFLDGEFYNVLIQADTGNQGYKRGIYCERNGAGGAANELTFRKCQIEDTTEAALWVKEGEVVSFLDGLIQSNDYHGIVFDKTNSVHIERTYFEANGQSNTADSADILDDATTGLSGNVNIIGNHFSGDGNSATHRVIDLADSRGFSIERNHLRAATAQLIRVAGTALNGAIVHNRAEVQPTLSISGEHEFTGNMLTTGATRWTGYRDSVRFVRQVVSYSATVAPDVAAGRWVRITLTGNITINAATNVQDEDEIIFEIIQDGTGGHTVTWSTVYRLVTNVDTNPSKRSIIRFIRDASVGRFIEVGSAVGST